MEDAIFSGVQLLFPDVSKLYCVCHIKQRDDIFFLAKSKCSENEKAFKAKYYWLEKIERILQNLCFFIPEIKFPLKLCTSSGLFLALDQWKHKYEDIAVKECFSVKQLSFTLNPACAALFDGLSMANGINLLTRADFRHGTCILFLDFEKYKSI